MKKLNLLMSVFILLIISTISCKKDKEPGRSELIVGTWHLSAWGQDSNMNGTLEVSEYAAIPSGSNIVETFNSDHSGTVIITSNGSSTTNTFSWQFQNNDQQLMVTSTGSTSGTSTVQVSALTGSQLMGYDIAGSPRTIIILIK